MNTSIVFGLILLALLFSLAVYVYYTNENKILDSDLQITEGFYPRRWWYGGPYGRRWAWRRPWLHSWGNWRPYGYYPAYSGYWKQCDASGAWCPAYEVKP